VLLGQIRYWDLVSGEQSQRLDGHSDYVRAAACSPANSNIWVTGDAHLLAQQYSEAQDYIPEVHTTDTVMVCRQLRPFLPGMGC